MSRYHVLKRCSYCLETRPEHFSGSHGAGCPTLGKRQRFSCRDRSGFDGRSLLREIFTTETDLIPNYGDHTLTVRLQHLTKALPDQAARALAVHPNESETHYPGTNLRLIFKLVSDENPPSQEF
jgi:hypothetical protein